jgi:hypothetical protein
MLELSNNSLVTISNAMFEYWNFNKEKRVRKVGFHSDATLNTCCKLVD